MKLIAERGGRGAEPAVHPCPVGEAGVMIELGFEA
jgi:hypothetical protein